MNCSNVNGGRNMKETKQFQTESRQLLNLRINSIYSNKEVFLREILSNASDAIDKYQYLSLTDGKDYPAKKEYLIRITKDRQEKSLTIADNGIGRDKEGLEENLGTIARSGSKEFLLRHKDDADKDKRNIIGQFGVGFYSAFRVAKRIEVTSKKIGKGAYKFVSDGEDSYSIEDCPDFGLDSGTRVKIFLKDDTTEENYSKFLDDGEIEYLVKKYSDYVRYPIKRKETHVVHSYDKDGKIIEGQDKKSEEDKTLNSRVPLWKKNKSEVTEEQLSSFYKSTFHDSEDPLCSLFVKVEGRLSFSALLFIPGHAPYDLYSDSYEKGLNLYTKGIFIKEKCKELIPDYLKFVKGLVDCDDFPLNISRERLQSSPRRKKISDAVEKKLVEKLKDRQKNDKDKFLKFTKLYGNYVKYGIYSSYGRKKDALEDLLRYTTYNHKDPISLSDYVKERKEGQKEIYFASGESREEISLLPQREGPKAKKEDVLFLLDDIDEFTLRRLHDYQGKEFKNVESVDNSSLTSEEKDKVDKARAEYKRFLDNRTESLKGKVDEVAFSAKLISAPVCLSTKEGISRKRENVLDSQAKRRGEEDKAPKSVKVLEINPDSDLFKARSRLDDAKVKEYASVLYDEARMVSGFAIEDKEDFLKKLNSLRVMALSK